jgi:hypothetical protein
MRPYTQTDALYVTWINLPYMIWWYYRGTPTDIVWPHPLMVLLRQAQQRYWWWTYSHKSAVREINKWHRQVGVCNKLIEQLRKQQGIQ